MVVPARMVLGDMTALGLIAAVIVDLLATAALMMLAARIYERAILRIGAPLKLGRLLASRAEHTTPVAAHPKVTETMGQTSPHNDVDPAERQPTYRGDSALRVVAVVLLLAGVVAIGTERAARDRADRGRDTARRPARDPQAPPPQTRPLRSRTRPREPSIPAIGSFPDQIAHGWRYRRDRPDRAGAPHRGSRIKYRASR